MSSLYHINKGVDQAIEFKGLKAQYIWWLGGGIVALLILFAVMYITGLNLEVCVVLVFSLGAGLFFYTYKMNKQYGEFGLLKKMAARPIPKHIKRN